MKLNKKKVESLVEGTKNQAYFIAKQFIEDDSTIEDILQESYIKAFNNINQLDDLINFNKWFNRIVVNTCKDTLKKKKDIVFSDISSDDIDINIEDKITLSPEDAMKYKNTSEVLETILNDISVEQRVSLFLFYYKDWSIKEISEHLEVKESTIKSRLHYGRKEVAKRVEKYQNKHQVKLYSTTIIPLLTYAWYQFEQTSKLPATITLTTTGLGLAQSTVAALTIKKVLISLLVLTTVVSGGYALYSMNQDEELVLRDKSHIVEYGEEISTDPSVYLENTDEELLMKTKVELDYKTGELASIGKHEITITYRSQSLVCSVEVKDTIAPTISIVEDFEVEYGTVIDDFTSYTTIEDLSEVTITIDNGGYDATIAATYTIVIVATDSSDNKSEIHFQIMVKEKPQEETIPQQITQEKPRSSTPSLPSSENSDCGESCTPSRQEICYGPGRVGRFYSTYAEAEAAGRQYIQSHPEEFGYNTLVFFSIKQCKAGYYSDFGMVLD